MQQAAVDKLIEVLDLEVIEVNMFRGTSPDEDAQRVFGGQVAGQALVAAARTVDSDRHVHSLHAYFLRTGTAHTPIEYRVERIRDGRTASHRSVVATQEGREVFRQLMSFQIDRPGPLPRGPGFFVTNSTRTPHAWG